MHKKLPDIADVRNGYTFRGPIEKYVDDYGQILVLQAKDVEGNKDFYHSEDLPKIDSSELRNPFFIQRNDILLVARGSGSNSFRSMLFSSDEDNIIISSSVHVIRVKDATVLPRYLLTYLNSIEGQRAIEKITTGGSYLKTILVKSFGELDIPIPPMKTQKEIIALNENILNQEKLSKRSLEIKKNIINYIFNNLTNK